MLKSLAILGVLAIVSSTKPHDAGRDKYPVPDNQPPHTIPTYTYNSNYCTTQAPHKSDEEVHHWYTPFQKPDWWILLVAAGTGGMVGWQAWHTREAAEATKVAAAATRNSVDLSASANTQWIRLKLLDMYSETDIGVSHPPTEIILQCRWIILNPSNQPLTLHWVKVGVARENAWHVCRFDFEDMIAPGEEDKILIVPIRLGLEETAEYLKSGVEHSISFGARFTGVNGRPSYQGWGDLFFFKKGKVEWNAALGKGPQEEYDEAYESEGVIRPSTLQTYEPPKPKRNPN